MKDSQILPYISQTPSFFPLQYVFLQPHLGLWDSWEYGVCGDAMFFLDVRSGCVLASINSLVLVAGFP